MRGDWIGMGLAALALATGCGDEKEPPAGQGTATGTGAQSGPAGTGGSGGVGKGGAAATGGGGAGPVVVNDCDPAQATDLTQNQKVTIVYGGKASSASVEWYYSPKCVRVAAGATVTFKGDDSGTGDFVFHPLQGGRVGRPDPMSPFGFVNTGSEKSFTMDTPGAYGYYCTAHASAGMYGAVFVE
jgi:plastocyanin